MESDSFFWQLLKQLPETLFALLGLPTATAAAYRFEALEVKKSYRHDGLFIPARRDLPLYFVEAQFRRDRRFYANLFAKVFSFLEKNDVNQEWQAVVLFENRRAEPKRQRASEVLIASRHLRRIFLDELDVTEAATPGLKLLQLVSIPKRDAPRLVAHLLLESRQKPDCERSRIIVELVEELLMRRFTELNREEVRRMFQLHDLRESKVWKEAEKVGHDKGLRKLITRWQAEGMTLKEIASLLQLPIADVRRLAMAEK